jgi:hypothetical protein
MSFFSKFFGGSLPEEREKARAEERLKVFPFLRKDPVREAAKSVESERLFWEEVYREKPGAGPEERDETIVLRLKWLLEHGKSFAATKPVAFKVIAEKLEAMGQPLRAGGRERWERIRQRVATLSGEKFAEISPYYHLLGDAPEANAGPAPMPAEPGKPFDDRDEALARKINRLLMSASFHDSRDPRAFKNLSGQLAAMGESIRAGGREHWLRIKERVKQLSGEHFVGLVGYYDLLGDAPAAVASMPAPHAQPGGVTGTAFKILFGRRTIEHEKLETEETADWTLFPAPDVAALAALPGQLGKCLFSCWHIIPNHPRPDAEVIQAWSAALGAELVTALGGTDVRQYLLHSQETGELSLTVIWDRAVSRAQVEKVAAAMRTFLGGQ